MEITTGPLRAERPEIDLCLGCARAFLAWTTQDGDEIDGEIDADDGVSGPAVVRPS